MASDIPVDLFFAVFRRFFCRKAELFFIAVPASPSEIRISFRLGGAVRRRSSAAKMRHCSIDCSRVRGGIQESGKRQEDAGPGLCYKSSHFETFLLNWQNSCCPTTALRTKADRSPFPFGRGRARIRIQSDPLRVLLRHAGSPSGGVKSASESPAQTMPGREAAAESDPQSI